MKRNPVVTFKRKKDDTGNRVADVIIDGVVVDTIFRDPDTTNWYSVFRPSSNANWELATTGTLDDLKYSIEHGSDLRYRGGRRYGTNPKKRNPSVPTFKLARGTLAYFDGMRGVIPIKIKSIEQTRMGVSVVAQVTAARGAYPKGHTLTTSLTWVIPRPCLKGRYKNRVMPYEWVQA